MTKLNGNLFIGNTNIKLNDLNGAILWTNPNPTSAFAAQNIVLSSSDYDMYEIVYEGYINGLTYYNSGKLPKGKGTALMAVGGDTSYGPYVYNRVINYINDTTLAADVCKQSYGSTSVTLNTLNIPIYVIGYKTGLFS